MSERTELTSEPETLKGEVWREYLEPDGRWPARWEVITADGEVHWLSQVDGEWASNQWADTTFNWSSALRRLAAAMAAELASHEGTRELLAAQAAELPRLREAANQAAEIAFHLPVAGRLVDRLYVLKREHADALTQQRERAEKANALLQDVHDTDAAAYEAASVVLHCQRQPTTEEDEAMRATARARLAVMGRVAVHLRGDTAGEAGNQAKEGD